MNKLTEANQEIAIDDMYETDIEDGDYGFILDADGKLKSVFLPETLPFKSPKNVQKIMKIFGVADISLFVDDAPLH
jgi:hypothetical protein